MIENCEDEEKLQKCGGAMGRLKRSERHPTEMGLVIDPFHCEVKVIIKRYLRGGQMPQLRWTESNL